MKIYGFGKRKNRILLYTLCAIISLVCVTGCILLFFKLGNTGKLDIDAKEPSIEASVNKQDVNKGQKEMRGVWIASTLNINFPSKQGLEEGLLKDELDSIVQNVSDMGLNAIFFQVRPCADALYNSEIFPTSVYLTGKQGKDVDEDFDCLEYLIEKANEHSIDVHAWVNPYRVTMYDGDENKLSSDNIAVVHPEYTVKYADGKTYFNPAIPEVQDLVVEGVKELVSNYPKLAGIHFDDYFYPYPKNNVEFDDNDEYEKYGNGKDKAQWRRENVNTLIKKTYEAIKSINPNCSFGVSPFGIWANNTSQTYVKGSQTAGLEAYSSLYCDALAWVEGGYVDYIAPQNYWSFSTPSSPFDNVARWWNANLDRTGVDLYMGHAAYKAGEYNKGELAQQVEFSRSLMSYKGSIFYGYEDLKSNTNFLKDDVSSLYKQEKYYDTPKNTANGVTVKFPENSSVVSSAYTYITGSSDPAYAVEFESEKLSRTKDGFFTVYKKLQPGQNNLVFTQNGKEYVHTINFNNTKSQSVAYKKMDKFEIGTVYPSQETWVTSGNTLTVSCSAPSGCVVSAKLGSTVIYLSPTINPPDESEYMYELYKGTFSLSNIAGEDQVKEIGKLVFTASLDGKNVTKEGGVIKQVGKNAYAYATIAKDYTHTKVSTSSSFYDDFLPSSYGMRDYIKFKTDGYYKLRFGGYVSEEEVVVTYGQPLQLNKIITCAMEVVCTDSTNNKNNTTDLRFGVTENIPVDVDFREESMRIIIYNTDTSVLPQFDIVDNPLVKSITGSVGTRENMVIYRVKLKDDNNFYGFNIVYEDGFMTVKLNNPQTLAKGEKVFEGKTFCIDAGHGGTDVGALGLGKKNEADLNLEIAQFLADKLENLGATVVRTRTDETTVSLYERMDLFNEVNPDLVVSIHHNSVASSSNAQKARGFLSLYSNNSGILLAKTLSSSVSSALNRFERPCAYQQLAVCRNHRFPSALLEMSFICNPEEYQWTLTPGNCEKSAQAIVDGLIKYYKLQEEYLEY